MAERRGISGPALVAIVFLLTTMTGLAFQTADFVFNQTGDDPYRAEGPVDSIKGIALFGGMALVVALAIALPLHRDPARARIGTMVLGSFSLLTLPFFWSGAPAVFGASAVWMAGLTSHRGDLGLWSGDGAGAYRRVGRTSGSCSREG